LKDVKSYLAAEDGMGGMMLTGGTVDSFTSIESNGYYNDSNNVFAEGYENNS
jgi:hypothetical protein